MCGRIDSIFGRGGSGRPLDIRIEAGQGGSPARGSPTAAFALADLADIVGSTHVVDIEVLWRPIPHALNAI